MVMMVTVFTRVSRYYRNNWLLLLSWLLFMLLWLSLEFLVIMVISGYCRLSLVINFIYVVRVIIGYVVISGLSLPIQRSS